MILEGISVCPGGARDHGSSLVGYIDTPVAGTTGTQFISSISVTKWHDYYLEVVPCGGYAHTAGSFTLTY